MWFSISIILIKNITNKYQFSFCYDYLKKKNISSLYLNVMGNIVSNVASDIINI